jgi:actin-related protein
METLVLDIGTSLSKCSLYHKFSVPSSWDWNELNKYIAKLAVEIPSVVGYPIEKNKPTLYGYDALNSEGGYQLYWFKSDGLPINETVYYDYVDYIVSKVLNTTIVNNELLLNQIVNMPTVIKRNIKNELLNRGAVNVEWIVEADACLQSIGQNIATVVDMGDGTTDISCCNNGIIPNTDYIIETAGREMTYKLGEILWDQYGCNTEVHTTSSANYSYLKQLKEQILNSEEGVSILNSFTDEPFKVTNKIKDKICSVLFGDSVWLERNVERISLDKGINLAIGNAPLEKKADLYKHIVLSGSVMQCDYVSDYVTKKLQKKIKFETECKVASQPVLAVFIGMYLKKMFNVI